MKRLIVLTMVLTCVLGLVGCSKSREGLTIEIIIPAGSTEAFVYSDEEISPRKDTLAISAGAGIATTEVVLKTVEVKEKNVYKPVTLKQTEPVKMEVEKGAWFKIGVAIQNPSNKDITVAVKVENVDIRISETDSILTNTVTESDETEKNSETDSERPGATRVIVEIRDRAKEEKLDVADAEEKFYEDENNEYYFGAIQSHYIMVVYNNGNSEDIVTALNAGRATIADLDEFGIEYHTEPKTNK